MLAHLLIPALFRPPATPLDIIADVFLVIGCVMIVLFTLLYGLRFRWYDSLAGASILALFCSISLMFILSVLTRVITPGDYLFRDLLRMVVTFLLPASVTFMFVTLFITRERLKRELILEKRQHHHAEAPEASVSDLES